MKSKNLPPDDAEKQAEEIKRSMRQMMTAKPEGGKSLEEKKRDERIHELITQELDGIWWVLKHILIGQTFEKEADFKAFESSFRKVMIAKLLKFLEDEELQHGVFLAVPPGKIETRKRLAELFDAKGLKELQKLLLEEGKSKITGQTDWR